MTGRVSIVVSRNCSGRGNAVDKTPIEDLREKEAGCGEEGERRAARVVRGGAGGKEAEGVPSDGRGRGRIAASVRTIESVQSANAG